MKNKSKSLFEKRKPGDGLKKLSEKARLWSRHIVLPKNLSRKKLILLAALAAVVIGGGVGLYSLFFGEEEAVALTEFTTEGSLTQAIEGTGNTEPQDSVTYTLKSTSAEVLEVCVKAGDTVKEGDLLFRQDDADVDETIAEYEDDINDCRLDLQDYQDKLSELSEALSNLTVTAPFSGRVSEVAAEAGEDVMSGSRLCVITDDSAVKLEQYFSYAYEDAVYVGMPAVVSVGSKMLELSGEVTEITKVRYVTSEGMECFRVTVQAENPGSLTEDASAGSYLLADDGSEVYPAVEGTLEYVQTKTISAKAGGELLSRRADDYQWVEKGEVLFTIEGDSYSTQIESVESQIEYLNDKIASLEENIEDAEESRENYARTSEIAGTVISCDITEGTSRMMAMQSVSVYSMDTMTISVNIDELDAENVYEGQEVTVIRSTADEDIYYEAYVSYLSLEATSSNGVATFPCTITIESEGSLTSGVNVSYIISTGDDEEGALAPIAALKTTDEGACLFVKADKKPDNAIDLDSVAVPKGFYAVLVEVGATNESYARIISGVESGVEVFTRYQQSAPSGGSSTSEGVESGSGGTSGMPDFSGGNMPSFGGGSGGGSMPSFGGGGMPG